MKALASSDMSSGCYDSRGGTKITGTLHKATLYYTAILSHTVINYLVLIDSNCEVMKPRRRYNPTFSHCYSSINIVHVSKWFTAHLKFRQQHEVEYRLVLR